jgi:hypothetical protein
MRAAVRTMAMDSLDRRAECNQQNANDAEDSPRELSRARFALRRHAFLSLSPEKPKLGLTLRRSCVEKVNASQAISHDKSNDALFGNP